MKDWAWMCTRCEVELDRDGNATQNIPVAGMHNMSEKGFFVVDRGEDVRLGAWSCVALILSVQQSSIKQVDRTARSSSDMAPISN